nr:hypothetical protein [uncultured Desulfobacter sp.]
MANSTSALWSCPGKRAGAQWLGRSRASSDFSDVTWEVPAMQTYHHQ